MLTPWWFMLCYESACSSMFRLTIKSSKRSLLCLLGFLWILSDVGYYYGFYWHDLKKIIIKGEKALPTSLTLPEVRVSSREVITWKKYGRHHDLANRYGMYRRSWICPIYRSHNLVIPSMLSYYRNIHISNTTAPPVKQELLTFW
jgi:hypothetical protein